MDLAITDFNKAIKLNPSNDNYYMLRAGCFSQRKDFASSIPDYQRAIELNSFDHLAILGKMEAEICLRKYDESLITYGKLPQMLDPQHMLVAECLRCLALTMQGEEYEKFIIFLTDMKIRLSIYVWCIEELKHFINEIECENDLSKVTRAKKIYQLFLQHFDDLGYTRC
ncbi:MAG: hypothetical protein AB1498_04145 [bacterium]